MHMFVQAAASKSGFIELVQVYFGRGQYLFPVYSGMSSH